MSLDSDLSRRAAGQQSQTQSRVVGEILKSSDFDRIEEINPFTGFSSNPAKFDRCVRSVKAKGEARNAYAVCNASMKGKSKHG